MLKSRKKNKLTNLKFDILENDIIKHCLIQILNFLILRALVRNNYVEQQKNDNAFQLSTYEASNHLDFNWYEPNQPDDKCFIRKSVPYEPDNMGLCLHREKYKSLLGCNIGISPETVKESHILVVGSTGVIGNSITSELHKQSIKFIEIKSHFQFNINFKQIYTMLKVINISSVILLANNETWKQNDFSFENLWKFCDKKKIPVFQIVKEFYQNDSIKKFKFDLIQIKSQPVWGPIFLTPYQREPGIYFYNCIINKTITKPMKSTPTNYVFSIDVADYVIKEIVLNYFNGQIKKKSQNLIIPNLPTTSDEELRILLKEKKCSIHLKPNNLTVSDLNRQKFEIVWKSLQTEENIGPRQKEKAYATLVACVSNKERIIKLFTLSLHCTKLIVKKYPNLAIEFLVLFCPTDDKKGKFYEVFDIPKNMRKFMRIIEIPQSYIQKLKKTYNISYFPEFILKNIGVRRASGDYVFAINSDVVLPVGFFECVQKKLFVPLSYIRSHRRMIDFRSVNQLLLFLYNVSDYKFMNQTFSNVCRNRRYYDDYDRNGCGDFQGSHKRMWFNIGGFIESNHVFHIDTALSLDFASLPISLFATIIGHNIHIFHEKESNATDHFKFYNDSFKNAIKQGVSSSMIDGLQRPNWGAKGMKFVEY